jgi:glycosyltransferase involved in cell wall biosynthesis
MSCKIDLIIPTYNNLAELKLCLASLAAQTMADFRVFLCVDGSTDGTQTYVQGKRWPFELIVLEHPDKCNHGRNPTRNLAVNRLQAEYVCLLDSDLQLANHALAAHLSQLDAETVVSVGAVRYTNAETNLWAAYQMWRGKNRYQHGQELPFQYFGIQNAMLATAFLQACGGFDTNMRSYGGNDNDLAWRLRAAGIDRFLYNEKALAYGAMNKDVPAALRQYKEFGTENLPYLLEKYRGYVELFQGQRFLRKGLIVDRLWSDALGKLIRKSLFRWPRYMQLRLLHYLVAAAMREGYYQK